MAPNKTKQHQGIRASGHRGTHQRDLTTASRFTGWLIAHSHTTCGKAHARRERRRKLAFFYNGKCHNVGLDPLKYVLCRGLLSSFTNEDPCQISREISHPAYPRVVLVKSTVLVCTRTSVAITVGQTYRRPSASIDIV
jgi:hypothetical protein